MSENAKAFWVSEAAGDTFNYPWEACEIYASRARDEILDLIAQCRDQHAVQASQWGACLEHYSSTDNRQMVSESSGWIERNNFAVQTLSQLLGKLERGRK